MEKNYKKLHISGNQYLAYNQEIYDNAAPYIVFLSGFMSDMSGTKASFIADFAKKNKLNYTRFDYFGHGLSSEKFSNCTIGMWLENCLAVIDQLTKGKVILIGSSMGGWLMLLSALSRKNKVAGMIGLASAPDFTEDLIWETLTLAEQQQLTKNGELLLRPDFCEHQYNISYNLITEARNHLLMKKDIIDIDIPTILIHGMNDKDVPYEYSIKLAEKLISQNLEVNLIKNSGHRLADNKDKEIIFDSISKIMREV